MNNLFHAVYRLPFRIFGIPVRLDFTFLLILPVLAWIIGSQMGRFVQAFALEIDPALIDGRLRPYLLGLVAAVGLFASILIHELGHSLVGQYFQLRIRHITLWVLGGMAQFERIPRNKGTEALMALAGPITSLLLGSLAAFFLWATPPSWGSLRFVLAYLMYMNFVLALFNLLPALPLDGGRIFRSLLALKTPYLRATQIAASVSKVLAVLLGLAGFLSVNLWLILLAFFIYIAVSGESSYATVSTVLRDIRVSDLMTREVHTVREDLPVSTLMRKMFEERFLAFPVLDSEERLVGFVTLQDVRNLKAQGKDEKLVAVADIMSRQVGQMGEHQSALDALQKINESPSGRLVVVNSVGELRGIISKTDLVRAIQVRTVETEFEE